MSKLFVATVPIIEGRPVFGPYDVQLIEEGDQPTSSADALLYRTSFGFSLKENPIKYPKRGRANLQGEYLGRLDEGDFGTTGRPAVILATGSKTALQWLRARVPDPDNGAYRFMALEDAWQITAVRDKLKALGIRWEAGDFRASDGTVVTGIGRPQLRYVYCGQSWDPFVPSGE